MGPGNRLNVVFPTRLLRPAPAWMGLDQGRWGGISSNARPFQAAAPGSELHSQPEGLVWASSALFLGSPQAPLEGLERGMERQKHEVAVITIHWFWSHDCTYRRSCS
ncbi:hypothetical protein MHYP_G00112460 [Metynnis hypsauchen]